MAWPSTLPAPSIAGYALNPVDPVIRTEMEAGAPRARRRTTARNDRINVSWKFTDAEMATFRAWFDGEGAGGSAWFYLTLAIGDTGTESVETRFAGIWQAGLLPGMNWQVSATLEVR